MEKYSLFKGRILEGRTLGRTLESRTLVGRKLESRKLLHRTAQEAYQSQEENKSNQCINYIKNANR